MSSSSHIFLGIFLESQVMGVQGRFTCIYSNLVPGNGIGEVSMNRVFICFCFWGCVISPWRILSLVNSLFVCKLIMVDR